MVNVLNVLEAIAKVLWCLAVMLAISNLLGMTNINWRLIVVMASAFIAYTMYVSYRLVVEILTK